MGKWRGTKSESPESRRVFRIVVWEMFRYSSSIFQPPAQCWDDDLRLSSVQNLCWLMMVDDYIGDDTYYTTLQDVFITQHSESRYIHQPGFCNEIYNGFFFPPKIWHSPQKNLCLHARGNGLWGRPLAPCSTTCRPKVACQASTATKSARRGCGFSDRGVSKQDTTRYEKRSFFFFF